MPPECMQKSEQQPHGSTCFGTASTLLSATTPQASELRQPWGPLMFHSFSTFAGDFP